LLLTRLTPPPTLPPFPTRRSSDLLEPGRDTRPCRPVHASRHVGPPFPDVRANAGGWMDVLPQPLRRSAHRRGRFSDGDRSGQGQDRKSTRLNSSHLVISYAVFCLK